MELNLDIALDTLEDFGRDFLAMLPLIVIALVILTAFFYLARVLRRTVRRVADRRRKHRNLGYVLGRLTQAGIIFLGVMIAAIILFPNFRPADLITLLGIGGVAIGFVFKDIFQNFLSGILILLHEPFRVGDQIEVGNFEGTVEEIQSRATFIRTYDGRRVVIPNSDLYTTEVTVNTAFDARRNEYILGIGHNDEIDRAREIILGSVREIEGVLPDPEPRVLVTSLGESTVDLRLWYWTVPTYPDVIIIQDRVLTAVKNALTTNGIDLPYPTRQILFHDQTEETDGDRSRQREGWPAGGQDVPEPRSVAGTLQSFTRQVDDLRQQNDGASREPTDRASPTG